MLHSFHSFHFLKFLLATLRLNKRYICELSAPLGLLDFHDEHDEHDWAPSSTAIRHYCSRCGKEFTT